MTEPKGPGLSVEALDRQNANAAKITTVEPPGELVEDVEGDLIGVELPTPFLSSTTTIVSPTELDRLGITFGAAQQRWPNLTIKKGRTA